MSSHLSVASGSMIGTFTAALAEAPCAQPFAAPDQVALEEMLKAMTEAPAG